jgi:molecular chaperone IbpA
MITLYKENIMTQLVRFDTNALNKALLGFDQLFDNFEHRFANQIQQNYPPYNILKHNDDSYELEIAVTGFAPEEITVEIDQAQLIVKGQKKDGLGGESSRIKEMLKTMNGTDNASAGPQYLHRSLATRDFTRSWTLAEHMEVGEGKIKNGVLTVALTRVVPEALKPRQLKITAE